MHVDTGSHYRTVTAHLLAQKVSPDNEGDVVAALQQLQPQSYLEGNSAYLTLDGQPVSQQALRSAAVNNNVSRFASLPAVRDFLKNYQRHQAVIARQHGFDGLVMEGRDIGSVILPDADLAVFLEADPATRAARRKQEGIDDSIAERDQLDTSRKSAPLSCPPNALRIDTGKIPVETVVERILAALSHHRRTPAAGQ